MTKYPCGRCKTEADIPTHQWVMYGWLDRNLDLTLREVREGRVTRVELDYGCWAGYRSGITRIIESQRNRDSGGLLPLRTGEPAVKDGLDGRVYALKEANYERFRAWLIRKDGKPLEPEVTEQAA